MEDAPLLAEALASAGMCEAGEAGPISLSWQTIRAWADLAGYQLSPGDLEDLRAMSAEFAAGVTDYSEVVLPPPFGERRQSKDQMVAQIHKAFGALMKRGKTSKKHKV